MGVLNSLVKARNQQEAQGVDTGTEGFLQLAMMEQTIRRAKQPKEDPHWASSPRFHPSTLSKGKFCPRAAQLARVFDEAKGEKWIPEPQLKAIFDVGTMYHHYVQNLLLGPAGLLVGAWIDVASVWRPDGSPAPRKEWKRVWGRQPTSDSMYGTDAVTRWIYDEPAVVNVGLFYNGHCDGILVDSPDVPLKYAKTAVLEIKTINDRNFKLLDGPQPDHKRQVAFYAGGLFDVVANLEMQAPRRVVFLYSNKNTQAERYFYEPIEQSLETGDPESFERLTNYVESEQQGKLACRLCKFTGDKLGVDCPAARLCWLESIDATFAAHPRAKFDPVTWKRGDVI